jgi:ketosteroid isomerase-like protein
MSVENVEIVRAAQEHFNRVGEPYWPCLHREVVVYDHDIPDGKVYRGHDGVTEWLADWGSAWESFELKPEELIDAGDQVIEVFTMTVRGKGSGIQINRRDAILNTLSGGLVIRMDYYNNVDQACAAAGLGAERTS